MWIATNKGWLSIVNHRDKQGVLLVRARNKNHIESIFEDVEVYVDEKADYPYRADIEEIEVSRIIGDMLLDITYDNFKASVEDRDYHTYLSEVWTVMYRYGLDYRPYASNQTSLDEYYYTSGDY